MKFDLLKLVFGKHYMFTAAEALIEVEYNAQYDHDDGTRQYKFICVKTKKEYLLSPEITRDNIQEVIVKATDGVKYDAGKLRYELMTWELVEGITTVLTYGALKYAPHNWKYVKGRRWRYFGAVMRHILEWWKGVTYNDEKLKYDKDTGLSHLYHAGCCLGFLDWCDKNPSPDDMEE